MSGEVHYRVEEPFQTGGGGRALCLSFRSLVGMLTQLWCDKGSMSCMTHVDTFHFPLPSPCPTNVLSNEHFRSDRIFL